MSGDPDPKPVRAAKAPPKRLRSKPQPARTAGEREASERFKRLVLALDLGCCVFHEDIEECDGPLQAHHCVTQQQLRKAGRDDLLWVVENGATLCEEAHRRHTLAVERVPLAALPRRCVAFAAAHGFEDILARYYPSAV